MRERRSRRWFIGTTGAAGAGAAGLALVGCGDDDDDDASPTATTGAGDPTATTAAGETPAASPTEGGGPSERFGGTVRYPMVGISSGDPPTLFPYENLTYLAQHPSHMHYSKLLHAIGTPDVDSTDFTQLEGDICEGLPEQVDELTYIFKIRPNVFFHDKAPMNGRQATMEDFAETYQAFLTASPNAGRFESVISSVEAVDAETLQVSLVAPYAPFLVTHAQTSEGAWFIPVETIVSGQVQTDPVGTGPYVFNQWETGVALRWSRNDNFFLEGLPNYEGVELSLQADPQRIISALAEGDLDWSSLSGTVHDEAQSRLDPAGTHYYQPTAVLGGWFFNFDADDGRWRDKRLRQALSMACDRQGWQDTLDQTGRGDWQSHISPALAPYFMSPRDDKDLFGPNAALFDHNPTEARALLEAATGGDSIQLRVTANVDRYGAGAQASWELFTSQIGDVGFNVELVYQDYASYIASTYLGQIEEGIGLGPLIGAPADPNDIFATNFESTSARHNWSGTPIDEMADLDASFEAQRRILDLDERIEAIRDIQRSMADSMLVVPYTGGSLYGYIQPWMQNFAAPKGGYPYHRDSVLYSYFTPERIAGG